MAVDGASTPLPRTDTLYADVIVPRHITKAFTYSVPLSLAQSIHIGSRVRIPFGPAILEGVVISLSPHLGTEIHAASLKTVLSLIQDGHDALLSPALLELSRKIAHYYVAPWGQCLRLIYSPTTVSPTRYLATPAGRMALKTGECPDFLRPTLQRIARRTTGILSSTLQLARRGHAAQAIDTLLKRSWVDLIPLNKTSTDGQNRQRRPLLEQNDHEAPTVAMVQAETLPEIDPAWRTDLAQCFQANHMRKIVLHAPWQHRIARLADAIQQAHSSNRSTIVVCGETAKAAWLTRVLVLLTGLPITFAQPSSASDRSELRLGPTATVVVGTRSAIFAPLKSIGLIWVEGEDDPALKEPQEPRYHAREVACLRAEADQAVVILASAHPSLEAQFDPKADIHHVQQDVRLQPEIELVDLRNESRRTPFSQRLIAAMHQAFMNQTKILLFLNRKGYARTLVCRDCGWLPRCPSCVVPLSYSREGERLSCRYCGIGERLPDCCPSCHASRISPVGDGTERVEAEARRLFPQAKVARLDGDTLTRPSSGRALWEHVRSGAWDILIGTEALFRREPLPQCGLVGILQADSGLHTSDFRAAERTYCRLIDAASLAQPACTGGRVILQTRLPTHHAIQAVLSGNHHLFYDEEYAARRLLNYPPTCHIADLAVIGNDLSIVEEASTRWAGELQPKAHGQGSITVLGPVPAIGRRSRGRHHRRILVKGTDLDVLIRRLHDSVQTMEQQYRTRRIKFLVDMDPVESG